MSLEDLRVSAAGREDSPTRSPPISPPFSIATGRPPPPSRPRRSRAPGAAHRLLLSTQGEARSVPPPAGARVRSSRGSAAARPRGLKGQRVSELRLVGLVKAGGEFTALATGLRDRSFC